VSGHSFNFYARRALELAVVWMYKHDPATKLPYQENLSALIHDPTFKQSVGPALFAKARLIKDLGNLAAHSPKPLQEGDSLRATTDLFHFLFWMARTYSRGTAPPDSLAFDPTLIPTGDRHGAAVPYGEAASSSASTVAQIQKLMKKDEEGGQSFFRLSRLTKPPRNGNKPPICSTMSGGTNMAGTTEALPPLSSLRTEDLTLPA
jgi:hypothetical protein